MPEGAYREIENVYRVRLGTIIIMGDVQFGDYEAPDLLLTSNLIELEENL